MIKMSIGEKLIKTSCACLLLGLSGLYPALAETRIIIHSETYSSDNNVSINGNGVAGTQKRSVTDFYSLKVSGGINVNYRHAKTVAVEVTGDQNLLANIKTEVNQGILVISPIESYRSQLPLTVELSSPVLSDVSLHGTGNMTLQGLQEKSFNLVVSGSGQVVVEGNVGLLSTVISGSGGVNAKSLLSEQADVGITGSGSMIITAKDTLKASVTGSGDIHYFGHPKMVQPWIHGSGNIEPGN